MQTCDKHSALLYLKRIFVYLWFYIAFLFFANTALSLDLHLGDRLDTPAKAFKYIEKTPMLALQALGDRVIAVGDRGVIAFTDDEGTNWQQAKVPLSSLLTSVHFPVAETGWAVGHGGSILRSQDSGQSWVVQLDGREINELILKNAQARLEESKQALSQASDDEQADFEFAVEDAEFALSNAHFDLELGPANPLLDVFFVDEKTGFAVGAYGLFLTTTNAGENWHSIAMRLENFDRYHLNAITQLEGGALLIAGEAGTLFASYDQGTTWETLYGPYQGSYFGIQATATRGEAFLYGLKGHVFKTTDSGQSWTEITTGIETSLTASDISSSGRLVVVGFSGAVLMLNDEKTAFTRIPTKGFESFTAVEFLGNKALLLSSDEGIQRLVLN